MHRPQHRERDAVVVEMPRHCRVRRVSHELLVSNWTSVSESLANSGSARIRGALGNDLVQHLIGTERPPWHALPADEGVVHQSGFGSYMVLADAAPLVRGLGDSIVLELTNAAPQALPAIPEFNEVSWTLYLAGTGHITTHRDPAAYGGIIAIATLLGRATFRIWSEEVLGTPAEVLMGDIPPTQWDAAAGDLILLRGNGWPTATTRCPMHEADAPPDGERIIMTFRHNTRGAGAGYDVDHP
jgi:hypothetical protein